jgi:AmiR/NasT family two-component response regulator
VIALIHASDPDFVKEASKRGVFAYITDADAKDWQSSIDIVLRRFAEYHDLEGALREHARAANRKLVDIAAAVVDGHRLLPKQSRTLGSGD